jgi:hypothetical protein
MNPTQSAAVRRRKRVFNERQTKFDDDAYARWTIANMRAYAKLRKMAPV